MAVYAIGHRVPVIHPTAYVHPDATVIGSVTLGPESSVWPGAVLRGDSGNIVVGARTSIQDGTVVHCTAELDTVIGDGCVVGHNAHLEGCTVADGALVGSGAVVLHRAVVGRGAIVGAAALVTNGTFVPPGAMALGVPATVREGAAPPGHADRAVAVYVARAKQYRADLRRID